ncbi:MAG: DUF4153 domain-containing protein [Ignavibacteria bacterium]|nr:DUF4153 domain-containing protein [Ignavibacteria bacterium]
MKLPSLQQIAQDAVLTFKRFPLVLLVAAMGTLASLWLADQNAPSDAPFAFRLLFTSLLGIPLLIGTALLIEKRRWNTRSGYGLNAAALLLLVAYCWSLPSDLAIAPNMHAIRLLMLAVGLHLFVAVAPYLGRGESNGFWQYNRTLFLRILTALLFTGVLYLGLSIALAAVENLFGVDIPGKRYLQLWALLCGMLTTWFFLAGIPSDLDGLESVSSYPKGLKVFAQYVLLPLVFIYFLILAGYSGKILVSWQWPFGWVSRLILGFSTAGMFALLLLHPIRKAEGNAWIDRMSSWFYIVLAPLVLMYFLAVLTRISEYGITEGRYVAIVIGIWLAGIVLYFLFSGGRSIKVIPLTLCIVSLAITVGPWGAFAVSESSQVARLERYFTKNAILEGGKVRKAPAAVSFTDTREISSILSYLHEFHGYDGIQPWFKETLRQDSLGMSSEFKEPSAVTAFAGIEYTTVWLHASETELSMNASDKDAMIVTGYDALLPMQFFGEGPQPSVFTSGAASYTVNTRLDTVLFTLKRDAQVVDTLRVPLRPLVDGLMAKYGGSSADNIPLEEMSVTAANDRLKLKVYLHFLRLKRNGKDVAPTGFQLELLYARRDISTVVPANSSISR